MRRWVWFGLGALTGVAATVATIAVALFVQFFFPFVAPTREVTRLTGVQLPAETRLVWQREERVDFLGDGEQVRVYSMPPAGGRVIVEACPSGFRSDRLDATNAWRIAQPQGAKGSEPACEWHSMRQKRDHVVVITAGDVYHLAIDH